MCPKNFEVHRVWFIRLCRFEKGVGEAEQLLMEIMLKILMVMMVTELVYKESQISETSPFLHQDFFLKVVHSGAQGQYSTRQSAPFDQILLS